MSDKAKGWVLVLIQFMLLAIILFSSAYEFKYINRPFMPVIHYVGVSLILIGSLFFIVILINFGQFMTPNPVPRANYKLKTTGVYKYIRHPMYFTVLILMVGIVLYFHAFYSFAWIVILFIFFIFKSTAEEKFLSTKFPEYTAYRLSTKRILPFIY